MMQEKNTRTAQFAHDLIEESLRSPQASVATILRKLRLKVVKNLPSEPTTKDLLPLIYTFMYVYYGNPMTVLRLIARGEENYVRFAASTLRSRRLIKIMLNIQKYFNNAYTRILYKQIDFGSC
jgi:hypothetical protein